MSTYYVENFGCRATQADGAALERQFEIRGLTNAPAAQADLVVLNSCTVTNSADQDARAAVRRVRRQNPLAKIIVTGCYAQRAPAEIAALPGVSAVIGNSHKHQLADLALSCFTTKPERNAFSRAIHAPSSASALAVEVHGGSNAKFVPLQALTGKHEQSAENFQSENSIFVSNIFAHTELLAAPVFESENASSAENARTRPNLKVQDGCNNRCSFCVIPSVRGHSRSLPLREIIREVHSLVAAGYRELVISGINLGRWGRDLDLVERDDRSPKPGFEFLLRAILAETELEKLRISSVEPMDWTDELISLFASSPRIAKHAHVPLQSGSDAVLRRMHRKYRPWHYREKIEKIRTAMPTAAIGADVMTGFPGETSAEFEATRSLIEDLPFTYLHVFTYSARPGTPAAAMSNQVPVHVARERNKILRDLAEEKKLAFMKSFVGKSLEAITLGSFPHSSSGRYSADSLENRSGAVGSLPEAGPEFLITEALTDNFQKLHLKGRYLPNRWMIARVGAVQDGVLVADI